MEREKLKEEIYHLAELQFSPDEIETMLGLENRTIDDDGELQLVWRRGMLQAQKTVREQIYESAKEGKTSQSSKMFLTYADRLTRWDAETTLD